ncbi:DnrO protein [Cognatiluteimonas telluris]|jgi:hypothetical protein|uniref:DnrO protein n=1 Tax=Cognatiluteimonas telluris TaxID=1104775 RepID=UPI00140E4441|nr:DnrO protein [Lysobacter telluris]
MHLPTASLALVLLLGSVAPAAFGQHAHPAAPVDPITAPEAAPATRWKTDAPLREGMGRIRTTVDALGHQAHGHLDPQQVRQLATSIERDIGFIVTNCKLEPRADAALHPILGALARGAQAVKDTPADDTAIPSMRAALGDYARLFDDPGVAGSGRGG